MINLPEEVADEITAAVLKQHLAYVSEDLDVDLLNATEVELTEYGIQSRLYQALKVVLAYFGEHDA